MKNRVKRPHDVFGWRENVSLPDLGITHLRAKIDTGARTSALHAVDLEPYELQGVRWISFRAPVQGMPADVRLNAPVLDQRAVKNTGGIAEQRLFIATTLLIGPHRWHIEVSLANREQMGFDLILGRTAIRGRRVLINPGRSFLANTPMPSELGAAQQSPADSTPELAHTRHSLQPRKSL